MTIARIWGRAAEPTTSGDGAAFATNFLSGIVRKAVPPNVGRIIDKLVDGQASPLSADERAQLAAAMIAVAPVPRVDADALGTSLIRQGVPPAIAAARVAEASAQPDAFVSVEPISAVQFFRPVDFNRTR